MTERVLDFVIVGQFNSVFGSFREEVRAVEYRKALERTRKVTCKIVSKKEFLDRVYRGIVLENRYES